MNERTLAILRTLYEEHGFVAGPRMSTGLGISRSAIWRHIQHLRGQGYRIESAPNRGYRLVASPDAPTAADIEAARAGCRLGARVVSRATIDSTNRLGIELAEAGEPDGTLVIAEHQAGGRGRMTRSWHSVRGQSITMSVILRPRIAPVRVPQLSLVTAIACAKAIETECALAVQVKWPNDLYINTRKVAGILCDLRAEMDCLHFLVLGIGINVNIPRNAFPPECRETATSLTVETGEVVNRARLVVRILEELEEACDVWLASGLPAFIGAWRQRSLYRGRRVTADTGGREPLQGVIRDLRHDGALLLETDGGEIRPLYSGDVSLQGMAGGKNTNAEC